VWLARSIGVDNRDLIHVRRGALLHDIGIAWIPYSILHKPGPLTEEDWAIVRQHPAFARQLLEPIELLRPALDIPIFHHERWDGTGYPLGLHGEELPLVARVFAVVDVWITLGSDRPYRKAWNKERALQYILKHAGTQFDPSIVEAFVSLLPHSDKPPMLESPVPIPV
jgi:HD-GYP domain-containing protein (c-di-GMP phosphodiesterase class II)